VAETNWAGTHTYRARAIHRPATLDELRAIVAAAESVRVLGSRHSFTDLPDAGELVALDGLAADVRVDRDASTVTCGGAVRYGELAEALQAEGLALHNLASLPHISVAGAIATATHGSGHRAGNLATAVAGLELVTSTGDVVTARRGDDGFDGMAVALGALGAVTRVTLDVEPFYEVRQRVFEGLTWDALHAGFDAVMQAGDSVSVFTRWGETTDQVWVKTRVAPGVPEEIRPDLLGARAATVERHPILGLDPVNCTAQLGAPGPWWDRLPHFRMGFTPSAGEEIQSEYIVARPDTGAAIEAVRAIGPRIAPVLQVSEIRTIAADRLWLSPQYGQDAVAIHFTWTREPEAVGRAIDAVEAALAPVQPRPHWGKAFHLDAAAIAPRYERLDDFAALAARLDPRGAFRNAWLERHVAGAA
jgi:alditol oxidase